MIGRASRNKSGFPRPGWSIRIGLGISLVVASITVQADRGRGAPSRQSQAPAAFVPCATALGETERTGRPTVIVITSRAVPESLQLRDAVARELAVGPVGAAVQFAEMPVELYPDRVERLQVRRFPTVMAYGRHAAGIVRLGHLAGPQGTSDVVSWLQSLGLATGIGEPGRTDPSVSRAGLFHHPPHDRVAIPVPSPQHQPPSPPPAVPVAKAAPPQFAPPRQAQPRPMAAVPVSAPMSPVIRQESGPPILVQQQAPAIYVQPSAPRIILGQAPPPEITIVQAPAGAPTVQYAVATPTQAAAPNLFLAQPSAAPSPTPMAGMPSPQSQSPVAAAPQAVPMPAMAYPSAAAQPMAAMTAPMVPMPMAGVAAAPQQSIVGATAIALLLENPDLINAFIGVMGRGLTALGGLLEKHGHPRVRVPRPEPPAPASAMTLVPTQAMAIPQAAASYAPVQTAIPMMAMPAAQPVPTAQPMSVYAVPTPPATTPTPQSPPPGHSWGHKTGRSGLFGRFKKH